MTAAWPSHGLCLVPHTRKASTVCNLVNPCTQVTTTVIGILLGVQRQSFERALHESEQGLLDGGVQVCVSVVIIVQSISRKVVACALA